jgi:hypothetical protein
VVSDTLSYADLYETLQAAEEVIARPVNPTVMTYRAWRARRAQPDSFVARIARRPRLFVLGSDDDLA